jgi:HAD superfamily hydrolase (TIGR01549 family)
VTIKAAIFDLDGTLVNLPINYEALYEEFKKITGIQNIEPVTESVAALDVALKGKVFEAWAVAEFAVLPKMTPVPKGLKLYQQYDDRMCGLVTMQGKKTVERILKTLNLSFQAIVTREDSLDRTTQIRIAIGKLRLEPESVIVIGDRETDKTAAEKVGCKFKMVKGDASLV